MHVFDPASATLQWSELDRRAVDAVRVLAADAVEKVGNGHPGQRSASHRSRTCFASA